MTAVHQTKILLFDDSQFVLDDLTETLENANYRVVRANNGFVALQTLQDHPDTKLVVSDINMPELNGLGMLEKLRQSNLNPDILVIMLTTEGNPNQVRAAQSMGAQAWLLKPVDHQALLVTIETILAKRKAA